MFRFQKKRDGQSIMEFVAVTTIVLGAFIGTQLYIKRGIQGRWKSAIDDLGDQYDPLAANSNFRYILEASSNTSVETMNVDGIVYTKRQDKSVSKERKQGYFGSGAYNFFD